MVASKVQTTMSALKSLKGGRGEHMKGIQDYVKELGDTDVKFDQANVNDFIRTVSYSIQFLIFISQ